jgi:hypothetical protein
MCAAQMREIACTKHVQTTAYKFFGMGKLVIFAWPSVEGSVTFRDDGFVLAMLSHSIERIRQITKSQSRCAFKDR